MSQPPYDSPQIDALWQEFGRSDVYREALKWIKEDLGEGAMFVAFRAGLDRGAQLQRDTTQTAPAK